MLREAILGLTVGLLLTSACVAEDDDSSNPGPDAGGSPFDTDDEPLRPGRPDASPEDLIPDAAPPLPCVEGDAQVSDPDTGHCYILIDTSRQWTAAQGVCTDPGMHLATVADELENERIRGLVGGREAWIAGNDIASEPTESPLISPGRYLAFCSSLAQRRI